MDLFLKLLKKRQFQRPKYPYLSLGGGFWFTLTPVNRSGISGKIQSYQKNEVIMSEISLQDSKINFEGKWFSAEDLTGIIQEKMQSGEMKFANLATALEELNNALENAAKLDVQIILSKEEYENLKALGGDDDNESIRKAVMAFINKDKTEPAKKSAAPAGEPSQTSFPKPEKTKKTIIKCSKCKKPIEITTDERPIDIECPHCGTSLRLKAQDRTAPVHKDHFLG